MALKVIVWGTGNVGRPAIRAVCTAAPGVVAMLELPDITGAAQLQVE